MEDSNQFSTEGLGRRGLSYIRTQYLSRARGLLWTRGQLQVKTYWGPNVYGTDLMLGPEGLYIR